MLLPKTRSPPEVVKLLSKPPRELFSNQRKIGTMNYVALLNLADRASQLIPVACDPDQNENARHEPDHPDGRSKRVDENLFQVFVPSRAVDQTDNDNQRNGIPNSWRHSTKQRNAC